MNTNYKILKNGFWLFLLQLFNMVVPLLTIPYVTRVLGASNYGIFSLALNWITYIQVIVEYGFAFTGAMKVSINDNIELQSLFSRIITARIILMVLTYCIFIIVGYIIHINPEMFICINILFIIIFGIACQLNWLFQGKQDMKLITFINAVARSVSVMLVFLLVKDSQQIYIYCYCYALTFLLTGILGIIVANQKYKLKFRFSSLNEAFDELKDGWHLFISQAMARIFSGFGITVLGIFSTTDIVGVYSAIYKIPFVIILFFNPISQAIYPHMTICFNKSLHLARTSIMKIIKLIIPVFIFFSIIIIGFRKEIVDLAFGKEYSIYSGIIIPLMIWVILSIVNNFLGIQILIASGNSKIYSRVFCISSLGNIIFNITLALFFNIYGVAVAAPLGEFLLFLLLQKETCKLFSNENRNEK